MSILIASKGRNGSWKASAATLVPAAAQTIAVDPERAEREATAIVTKAVSPVQDKIWLLELAALAAASDKVSLLAGQELARSALDSASEEHIFALPLAENFCRKTALRSFNLALGKQPFWKRTGDALLQIIAFKIAWLSALVLLLRHGGSSPRDLEIKEGETIFALHAEDTTRTRHLRGALVKHLKTGNAPTTILLLGRPAANMEQSSVALDPAAELGEIRMLRPMNIASLLLALPQVFAFWANGVSATGCVPFSIPMRERIAMAYRFVQGAAQACWWQLSAERRAGAILFGHTGTADTTILERAMQKGGAETIHVVHGTNVGWPFAGLSDAAIFQTGADAALGASLPGYRRNGHIPASCPQLRGGRRYGDGRWALLTSYTHLSHPAYHTSGAEADIALIEMTARAAAELGQPPEQVLWRPHPHIDLVAETERQRLNAAVQSAGFTRWPAQLPYESLGDFAAAITSPSTVLTDALRLGQPAIVVSLTPLQNDLVYNRHNLLVGDLAGLLSALRAITDQGHAATALQEAWAAIQPGGPLTIEAILAAALSR